MPTLACPSDDDLLAFLVDPTGASAEATADHLNGCPGCQDRAERLVKVGQTLAGMLQAPTPPATIPGFRVPRPPLPADDPAATADPADRPGGTWAGQTGYEILGELGRGGMGVVYKARDLRLNRVVALKQILGDRGRRGDRFRAEAGAAARLAHPNVVQVYEVGEHDGRPYIAFEYVDGPPLDRTLRGKPLPPPDAAALIEAVARGVHHAHTRGVVHRDLKPANIFLDRVGGQEVVKVLDFGIAKVNAGEALSSLGGDAPATAGGILVGTPAYMSPEQVLGRPLDGRSDLYALGVVAYRCLAGRLPFEGEAVAQLAAHAYEAPPPLPKNVAPGVAKLVLQLLAKDPQDRPNSAQALILRLDALGQPGPALPRWVPAVIGASLGVAAAGLWLALLQRPTINSVAFDAGFVDASAPDALPPPDAADEPQDATEIDATISDATEIDAGVEVILITGDWRDIQAVRQAAQRPLATAQECAEARPAVVRFEVTRAGTSISVAGNEAEALRRCLLLRLDDPVVWGTSVVTEGAVELRLD